MRRILLIASAIFLLESSDALGADGFALDRYEPSERGSDWHANESLDLRGAARPALGVVSDYAFKPLVFYDASGDEQAVVVEHQLFVHVGGAVVLFDRLRLGASLPLLVYSKGEAVDIANSSFSTSDETTIGDPRLTADVGIIGKYDEAFRLAFGAQAFVPVGSEDAFASDGKLRLRPRLMAAGDIGSFSWAAQVGFNYRARSENLGEDPFGSEATFAAAAGARLMDGKLVFGPEVFGSTVVSDSGDGFLKKRATPLELIVGAKYRVAPEWRLGAGVGPGLSRGVGAPTLRALASIEWAAEHEKAEPPPPPDRDGDGIADPADACPDEPGIPSTDPKTNGCPPPPADSDGDGIIDKLDACPADPGVPSDDPEKNGCPPPKDGDGDGILDAEDACPTEPGVPSEDKTKNGCPAPKDSDGDGVLDPEDACPKEAGPKDPDPKKNGCPMARIDRGKIEILEQIQFANRSDKILPPSDPVLQAVLEVLKTHPEITKLAIQGHTDNRGGKVFNKDLSKRRAASVKKWLVAHGIEAKRLETEGFGQDKPIDSNDTEEGRQRNRRVVFQITELRVEFDETEQGGAK